MRPFASRVYPSFALISLLLLSTLAVAAPTISSLSPTSGAVGASVTITGTNFGSTKGSSTVKFNGTTATTITGWTSTSIVAAVPTGATTGNVVVTVSGSASNGKSFTVVAAPSISSLSPTSAAVGTSVTISGSGFGSTQGSSTVKFNGTSGTPTSWSSTSIKVPVPAGATTGNVVVHASGVDSNGKSFTVLTTPAITNISPNSGMVGDSITITGTNFGNTQGTSTVKFNGTSATPTSWTDSSIVAPVPSGATTGNVVVTVSGVSSTGTSFTVVAPPSISSLSPSSGAAGALVTINGSNFQPTQGSGTVSFNGSLATPSTWSATQIKAPVPAGATTGSVVVSNLGLSSNGVTFTVKPTPLITSLSQTVGAVGMAVTISGANLGSSQGSSTVKFNGTTATASAWSASQVTVAVPNGATSGNVVVHTSGVDTNGIGFVVSPVSSISLTPQSLSIPVNSVQRLVATATYSNNSTQALTGNNVTWSSSDNTIATIDANGIARTLAQGQTTIRATVGTSSSSASLTVKAPSFVLVGSMNSGRWYHAATLLLDGRVLITGGGTANDTLQTAEIYDPVSKTFSWTGSMQTPRMQHTATLLKNGKVLVTGGIYYQNGIGPFSATTAEIYDPATGAFTHAGTPPLGGFGPATLLPNEKVLFTGWLGELYDPTTNAFTTTPTNSLTPYGSHSATSLSDGTVLVVGGWTDSSVQYSARAQTYDGQTGIFSSTGSLNTASLDHTLSLMKSGKALLVGGYDSQGVTLSRSELYDPSSRVFSPGANLAIARSGHAAAPLSDGSALAISGYTGPSGTDAATAELFDPTTQTFIGAGSLAIARYRFTATALNDGTVLVVGGSSVNGMEASAELYAPPLPPPASVQIVPSINSISLGQSQQFKAFDDQGHQRYDVTWTLSDTNIASLSLSGAPTLTTHSAGQEILTAHVGGVTAQLNIAIVPSFLQITPSAVTIQVGDSRKFTVVDNTGGHSGDAVWTVSDTSLATVTSDSQTTLTATNPGQVTLTATVEGVTAQAQVNIVNPGAILPGTTTWSAPSVPGYAAIQIAQAVPTVGGPDLYSVQTSADGTQSIVQALTADGQQVWQTTTPSLSKNNIPDGFGGLLAIEYDTCIPNQTNPLTVADLNPANGQPIWQVQAAGIWNGQNIVYCYGGGNDAPQIAVRGDGSVVITEPTNNGFPPLTVVGPTGAQQGYYIPPTSKTNAQGITTYVQCCMGPPMVNVDGTAYVEYEVRNVVNDVITSDTLYLFQINPNNSSATTVLSTTTQNEALLPGPIIPDGQGGVLATWIISPSNQPVPGTPNPHTYEASDIVGGAPGAAYDLPFDPHTITWAQSPSFVLGENGVAFAKGHAAQSNGSNNDVDQIASFNLNSGALYWKYQDPNGHSLSLVQATADGGVTVDDSSLGVFQVAANASASNPVSFLQGAVPLDLGTWISIAGGTFNALWNPLGANGLATILAQSSYPLASGNAQGQHAPPFCQRKNSNCVLAPHNDTVSTDALRCGAPDRDVTYEVFSLQNGTLMPTLGSSQTTQSRIIVLESNPTNTQAGICDWNTPNKCSSVGSLYTDEYTVGCGTLFGLGSPNTVKQQFFVDRGQVQVYWPTDGFQNGFPIKTWYGSWDQNSTTNATNGATIQQNNPNLNNGVACTLTPQDPNGCSPIQANNTN